MKFLSLISLVSAVLARESLQGKGTYTEEEYPPCFDENSFELYYKNEQNEAFFDLGLNWMYEVILLPNKRCQIAIDGVSNGGLLHMYLPETSNFNYPTGRYISYKWDKYSYN